MLILVCFGTSITILFSVFFDKILVDKYASNIYLSMAESTCLDALFYHARSRYKKDVKTLAKIYIPIMSAVQAFIEPLCLFF